MTGHSPVPSESNGQVRKNGLVLRSFWGCERREVPRFLETPGVRRVEISKDQERSLGDMTGGS